MTDKPILFSGEMVRAILEGRKTQTRRVITPQPLVDFNMRFPINWKSIMFKTVEDFAARSPYGFSGDRLWVRETFCELTEIHGTSYSTLDGMETDTWYESIGAIYRADCDNNDDKDVKWTPSIFMPRRLSRITLEIERVSVQRVQDIGDDSCAAEGVSLANASIRGYLRNRFKTLWDSINAKRGFPWSSNPWVWVVSFRLT